MTYELLAEANEEIERLRAVVGETENERDAWIKCAERLLTFAIAYRSHPLRNPEDKLDEVVGLYVTLYGKLKQP